MKSSESQISIPFWILFQDVLNNFLIFCFEMAVYGRVLVVLEHRTQKTNHTPQNTEHDQLRILFNSEDWCFSAHQSIFFNFRDTSSCLQGRLETHFVIKFWGVFQKLSKFELIRLYFSIIWVKINSWESQLLYDSHFVEKYDLLKKLWTIFETALWCLQHRSRTLAPLTSAFSGRKCSNIGECI